MTEVEITRYNKFIDINLDKISQRIVLYDKIYLKSVTINFKEIYNKEDSHEKITD